MKELNDELLFSEPFIVSDVCFLSKMNGMAIYFRYEGSSSFHFTEKKFHSVSLGFYQTHCISEVIIDIVANPVCRFSALSKRTF